MGNTLTRMCFVVQGAVSQIALLPSPPWEIAKREAPAALLRVAEPTLSVVKLHLHVARSITMKPAVVVESELMAVNVYAVLSYVTFHSQVAKSMTTRPAPMVEGWQ